MEAGPWRSRPRWAAPPEARDVVTGAPPHSALLGATNRLGLAAWVGSAPNCPSAGERELPRFSVDAPSDVVCPDDSVLMGSPQRAPSTSNVRVASRQQTRRPAKVAAAAGAAAASTASANVLLGSVVVSRPQHNALSGTPPRTLPQLHVKT